MNTPLHFLLHLLTARWKVVAFSETRHKWGGEHYKTTTNLLFQCSVCNRVKAKEDLPWMPDEELQKLLPPPTQEK